METNEAIAGILLETKDQRKIFVCIEIYDRKFW